MSVRERIGANIPSAVVVQLRASLQNEVYRGKRVPPDWDAGLPMRSSGAESGVVVRFSAKPTVDNTTQGPRQFTRKISFKR